MSQLQEYLKTLNPAADTIHMERQVIKAIRADLKESALTLHRQSVLNKDKGQQFKDMRTHAKVILLAKMLSAYMEGYLESIVFEIESYEDPANSRPASIREGCGIRSGDAGTSDR